MKQRILLVDDEKNIRRTLSMILKSESYAVREADSGEEALTLLADAPADLVLLDVGLPGIDGISTLKEIVAAYERTAVIMISGQATVAVAIEASRHGAFDFLEKPLSKDRVLISIRNALKVTSLRDQVDRYRKTEARRNVMVGRSEALATLQRTIEKVGATGATVLITGESGSGKELVARAVHDASQRTSAAFVKVNCAAIPEELIETELFGCIRGAYTGADRTREGKFMQADCGTIFLDEIGDMSLRVQAKVLRALQEGEIERVGDATIRRVDVRVLAATNKDLPQEVREGRFREDLFYRLNVVPVTVPPLRDRPDDIPLLANHFLQLYALENDLAPKKLNRSAVERLTRRSWRGNIRELRNIIERLAILSDGSTIGEADLLRIAPEAGADDSTEITVDSRGAGSTIPSPEEIQAHGGWVKFRREFERSCIESCLDRTGGNVSQAARLLGIERSNLHKKMQAYDLEARPPRGHTTDREGNGS